MNVKLAIVGLAVVAMVGTGLFLLWEGETPRDMSEADSAVGSSNQLACNATEPRIINVAFGGLKASLDRLGEWSPSKELEAVIRAIEGGDKEISRYATQRFARTVQNLLEISEYDECVSKGDASKCPRSKFVVSLLEPSTIKVHFGDHPPSSLKDRVGFFVRVWQTALVNDGKLVLNCDWAKRLTS